jgi:hypothetical protein
MSLKAFSPLARRAISVFAQIVTRSPGMLSIFQYIESIAASGMPVLILGKPARVRSSSPKPSTKSAAYWQPSSLSMSPALMIPSFSDTLFGHATGALYWCRRRPRRTPGKAADGTIFDEIGDLSEMSQVKLLRLLQEKHLPSARLRPAEAVPCPNRHRRQQRSDHAAGRDGEFRMDRHIDYTHLVRSRAARAPRGYPGLVAFLAAEAAAAMHKPTPVVSDRHELLHLNLSGATSGTENLYRRCRCRCDGGTIEEELSLSGRLVAPVASIDETASACLPSPPSSAASEP